jgi:hypothetical protein
MVHCSWFIAKIRQKAEGRRKLKSKRMSEKFKTRLIVSA